jgi:hypothetical protein
MKNTVSYINEKLEDHLVRASHWQGEMAPDARLRASLRRLSVRNYSTTTTPAPPIRDLLVEIRITDWEESESDFRDSAVIHEPVTVISFNPPKLASQRSCSQVCYPFSW